MFLNQMLEDYKESDDKQQIVDEFIESLWKSKYGFKKYKKYYTYRVDENLLSNDQELIELFNKYNRVEYTVNRSYYKQNLESIDMIRIRVNNIYGFSIDKDVYYSNKYYKLLITPKREYFKAINLIKLGSKVDFSVVRKVIEESFNEAEVEKQNSIDKKFIMKLPKYKELINLKIHRLFGNFLPVHEYEDLHGWEMRVNVDGWSEDNYIVKYFCKSLTGYMRNYIRDSKVEPKKCFRCNTDIGSKNRYCPKCARIIRAEKRIGYNSNHYKKIKNS